MTKEQRWVKSGFVVRKGSRSSYTRGGAPPVIDTFSGGQVPQNTRLGHEWCEQAVEDTHTSEMCAQAILEPVTTKLMHLMWDVLAEMMDNREKFVEIAS